MEGIHVNISNVPENAILAQDVFVKRNLLVANGTMLTERIIQLLIKRGIESVAIRNTISDNVLALSTIQTFAATPQLEANVSTIPIYLETQQIEQIDFGAQYIEAIAQLSPEIRYGRSFNQSEGIEYVKQMFVRYMENEHYARLLQNIKRKDMHTYLHVIDVFTLMMLFMQHEGYQDCEQTGIGVLMHDVGKLNLSPTILRKRGKLTEEEYLLVQNHTVDGYNILCSIGLQDVAYLALSHHEKVDGTGYPNRLNLLQQPEELRILNLIDRYSAITLTRSYKGERGAPEAFRLLFQEKATLDEAILYRFVEFIGIFPENAIVMLSDGTHAIIQNVREHHPLLPTVKVLATGISFMLPINFSLTISKLISYYAETPEKIFNKFTEYLINYDANLMEQYYLQLKEHYKTFEWFPYIYIPVYQILHILRQQNKTENVKLEKGYHHLHYLLSKTNFQMRLMNEKFQNALIIVTEPFSKSVTLQLFEGVLHMNGIYAITVNDQLKGDQLQQQIDSGHFRYVFIVGEMEHELQLQQVEAYYIKISPLESMIFSFVRTYIKSEKVLEQLNAFKVDKKLLIK